MWTHRRCKVMRRIYSVNVYTQYHEIKHTHTHTYAHTHTHTRTQVTPTGHKQRGTTRFRYTAKLPLRKTHFQTHIEFSFRVKKKKSVRPLRRTDPARKHVLWEQMGGFHADICGTGLVDSPVSPKSTFFCGVWTASSKCSLLLPRFL